MPQTVRDFSNYTYSINLIKKYQHYWILLGKAQQMQIVSHFIYN